ncbi:hypothetical protein KY284_020333 [Solanum tuberosum]|nr:hypothetical protein KY284_020333 [Solanum tuberosum]
MSSNRQWIYKRLAKGLYDPEFIRGVQHFIEFSMSHPEGKGDERLRCPCNRKKCQNRNFENVHTVHGHLLKEVARSIDQDERIPQDHTMNNLPVNVGAFDDPTPTTLVHEAAGPPFVLDDMEELPNPDAQSFYDMLDSANQEVWPGCETHSRLSVVSRLLHIKTEHHLSDRCFDEICQYMSEMLLPDNVMPKNFYETKNLMRGNEHAS